MLFITNNTNPTQEEVIFKTSPALHLGLSTALVMLLSGALHVPEPYEALVSCITFSSLPASSFRQYCINLGGITLGFIMSLSLLTFAPQQPWFYIPLVGPITAIGYKLLRERYGAGCANGFSIYFSVTYLDCLYRHFHHQLWYLGIHFWIEGFLALSACRIISTLTKKPSAPHAAKKLSLENVVVIALSISVASAFVMATGERQPGRLLLSNMATIISMELSQRSEHLGLRTLGLFVGVTIALCFISIIAPSRNSFTIYLIALGTILGFLKFLYLSFPKWGSFYENMPEIVAICIVMIPQPDRNPYMGIARATDAILGFFTAIIVFFITHHLRKWSYNLLKKASSY